MASRPSLFAVCGTRQTPIFDVRHRSGTRRTFFCRQAPVWGLTDVIICRVSRVPAVSPCRYRHPWLPRRHVLYFAVCRPKHTAKFFTVCPIKDTQRSRLCRQGWSPSRLRRGPRTANLDAVCFGIFGTRQIAGIR